MRNLAPVPSHVSQLIDHFFETPMKIDRKGELHDIKRSSLRRSEALTLAALVYDLRPEKSIEIGLAEGGSCVAISASRRHLQLFMQHCCFPRRALFTILSKNVDIQSSRCLRTVAYSGFCGAFATHSD